MDNTTVTSNMTSINSTDSILISAESSKSHPLDPLSLGLLIGGIVIFFIIVISSVSVCYCIKQKNKDMTQVSDHSRHPSEIGEPDSKTVQFSEQVAALEA